MTSHEQTRINRLRQIKKTIEEVREHGVYGPEQRERLINEACMEWGCTRRKILEYLKVVESI